MTWSVESEIRWNNDSDETHVVGDQSQPPGPQPLAAYRADVKLLRVEGDDRQAGERRPQRPSRGAERQSEDERARDQEEDEHRRLEDDAARRDGQSPPAGAAIAFRVVDVRATADHDQPESEQ